MTENQTNYLKAWAGTALAVLVLLGITWLSAAILDTRPVVNQTPGDMSPEAPAPGFITVEGTFTCLPHKDTTGPQTLECAMGLAAATGEYYALDVSAVTYPADLTRARVSGQFVPSAALSTDAWQKYQMEGIIRVESVEPL